MYNSLEVINMEKQEKTIDKESLYRMRLSVETNVNANTVFRETEPIAYRLEKDELQKLVDACDSEEEYMAWKKEFLDRMVEELKETHFLTCKQWSPWGSSGKRDEW